MEQNIKSVLGKRIRQERNKKGWSIEKLAEMVDLSPSSLGLVERADRALSIEKLYLVANALEVTVDSLLSLEDLNLNKKLDNLKIYLKELSDNDYTYILNMVKLACQHFKTK